MRHWAIEYIGKPWVKGENDCWNFCRHIWQKHYNIIVPVIDIDASDPKELRNTFRNHQELQNWEQIDKPIDGAAVLMRTGRMTDHCGIWLDIDKGKILHCIKPHGVIIQSKSETEMNGRMIEGYYTKWSL